MKFWLIIIPVILLLSACGGGGTPGDSGGSLAGSATGLVADTGQTSCYYDYTIDGFYNPTESVCLSPGSGWSPDGQDGYYNINSMSFTDNSDGTILDNVTGLTWQKCSLGESGADCLSGSITSHTWSDAKSQCANSNLAGGGWRLPNVFELTQIVNYGNSFGTIDQSAFPGTGPSPYWSNTAHAIQAWAWYVSFSQGVTWADNQTGSHYVRCVRG